MSTLFIFFQDRICLYLFRGGFIQYFFSHPNLLTLHEYVTSNNYNVHTGLPISTKQKPDLLGRGGIAAVKGHLGLYPQEE